MLQEHQRRIQELFGKADIVDLNDYKEIKKIRIIVENAFERYKYGRNNTAPRRELFEFKNLKSFYSILDKKAGFSQEEFEREIIRIFSSNLIEEEIQNYLNEIKKRIAQPKSKMKSLTEEQKRQQGQIDNELASEISMFIGVLTVDLIRKNSKKI
jgi:hypothetical protein